MASTSAVEAREIAHRGGGDDLTLLDQAIERHEFLELLVTAEQRQQCRLVVQRVGVARPQDQRALAGIQRILVAREPMQHEHEIDVVPRVARIELGGAR